MTEAQLQTLCIDMCRRSDVDCLHVVNESGKADRRSIGMRSGTPDLLLVGNTVAFVELKKDSTQKPSASQQAMLSEMGKLGLYAKVVYNQKMFGTVLRRLQNKPSPEKPGVAFGLEHYSDGVNTTELQRVYNFFIEKQNSVENPIHLFAVRLFNNVGRGFPWLCNIKDKYFVATKTSKITTRILLAGWDVVFI